MSQNLPEMENGIKTIIFREKYIWECERDCHEIEINQPSLAKYIGWLNGLQYSEMINALRLFITIFRLASVANSKVDQSI